MYGRSRRLRGKVVQETILPSKLGLLEEYVVEEVMTVVDPRKKDLECFEAEEVTGVQNSNSVGPLRLI